MLVGEQMKRGQSRVVGGDRRAEMQCPLFMGGEHVQGFLFEKHSGGLRKRAEVNSAFLFRGAESGALGFCHPLAGVY